MTVTRGVRQFSDHHSGPVSNWEVRSQSEIHGQAQAWLYGVINRYTYIIAQGAIESHRLSLNGTPEPMSTGAGGSPRLISAKKSY